MRSALGGIDGVHGVDGDVGQPNFAVKYDNTKVNAEQMKAACDKAGHEVVIKK